MAQIEGVGEQGLQALILCNVTLQTSARDAELPTRQSDRCSELPLNLILCLLPKYFGHLVSYTTIADGQDQWGPYFGRFSSLQVMSGKDFFIIHLLQKQGRAHNNET